MAKKIKIVHIYYGTSGSAGLYIDRIYKSLFNSCSEDVIVNYYFPFNYGQKVFYKYSELSSPYAKKYPSVLLRHLIRFLELLYSLLFSLFYVLKHKVEVINYNLTADLFPEYLFLLIIKKFTKIKIFITCHDVIPFNSKDSNIDSLIENKNKFFKIADKLIVHNQNSINDLMRVYGIDEDRVIKFNFPTMNLNNLGFDLKDSKRKKFRIGMVGHFRKEKGVQILIDAWRILQKDSKDMEILLAGNFPKDILKDVKEIEGLNAIIMDGFVSDKEYVQIIKDCDVIVLPYTRGTNSGIPSSVILMNTLLLTSDIEMFKNNKIIHPSLLFESGNPKSLAERIVYLYNLSNDERSKLKNIITYLVKNYENEFDTSVKKLLC